MKKKLLAVLAALALAALAFFAADIPFYPYAEPLERASLSSANDGRTLSFSYTGASPCTARQMM